jgi:uncharacterized RDD family membrane protein YckC
MAKMVDILLVLLLASLPIYPAGPLLGFAYSLVADGLRLPRRGGKASARGQSVGKWLFKIRVVMVTMRNVGASGSGGMAEGEVLVRDRQPASIKASVLRNAPVGVATFFAIIPLWGWIILGLVGIPLMIMEVYLMATVETGHRLGDVMGDTEVVHV